MADEEIFIILERRERKALFAKLQAAAEKAGYIPPMPFLVLQKFTRPLQYIGGMFIGILVGTFTLLLNFAVFVWLLHLEF